MATTKTIKEKTSEKVSSNKSSDVKAIKTNGLIGLYKGKMFLNGTSNEVFNLGL